MAEEDRPRYLFVAADRATRWVFVRVYPAQATANARRFQRDLARAAPMYITLVFTDRAIGAPLVRDNGEVHGFYRPAVWLSQTRGHWAA